MSGGCEICLWIFKTWKAKQEILYLTSTLYVLKDPIPYPCQQKSTTDLVWVAAIRLLFEKVVTNISAPLRVRHSFHSYFWIIHMGCYYFRCQGYRLNKTEEINIPKVCWVLLCQVLSNYLLNSKTPPWKLVPCCNPYLLDLYSVSSRIPAWVWYLRDQCRRLESPCSKNK